MACAVVRRVDGSCGVRPRSHSTGAVGRDNSIIFGTNQFLCLPLWPLWAFYDDLPSLVLAAARRWERATTEQRAVKLEAWFYVHSDA